MINNKKINELIFLFILLIPITTILQGITIFTHINKIIIGILILLIMVCILTKHMSYTKITILSITTILYIFSLIFTKGPLEQINDLFYFGFWIMFFVYLKDNIEEFKINIEKNYMSIKFIILLWDFLVLISLLFSSSFIDNWGSTYFCSFSNDCHRFASTCIFILILDLIILQKNKKWYFMVLLLIPYISIFFSGTRIYLILVFIIGLSIIYCLSTTKRKFIYYCIIFTLFSSFLILITPMGQKFLTSRNLNLKEEYFVEEKPNNEITENEYEEKIEETEEEIIVNSITSGRTIFWKADVKGYLKLNILNKLVGNGFNYVYDLNEVAIHNRIWAHNDIINILLNFGLIGVILYFYVFISFCIKYCKFKNIPSLLMISFTTIYLSNAMINMVYTYINAVLILPFILYTFSLKKIKSKFI